MLDVRTKLAVGDAVRVADRPTGNGMLAADSTNLRHGADLHISGARVRPPSTHSCIRIAQTFSVAICFSGKYTTKCVSVVNYLHDVVIRRTKTDLLNILLIVEVNTRR